MKRSMSDSWQFTQSNTAFYVLPIVAGFVWAVLQVLLVSVMRIEVTDSNM